jgi:threonylcarbamoyladenosine tRNA methylthiotransferase MtaB
VPHFHIPLQSGSNDILKLMKRRYQREVYTERVNKIREVMPHACIGVDVIVFRRNRRAFLETYHFLNEMNILYLHVFTYSERDNTEAAAMEGVVPANVRAKRKMLRGLLKNAVLFTKVREVIELFCSKVKIKRVHSRFY